MQCSNSGCTERLTKVDIKVHESFECYWRKINCEHCQESFVLHEKRVCRHSYKQMNFQWNLLRPNYIAKLSPQQRVLSISVSPKAVILLVLAFNLYNSYIYTLHCLLLWERLRKKMFQPHCFLWEDPKQHTWKNTIYFLRVLDFANQLLTHHSPFAPLGRVDEWTAKPSPFSIQGRLTKLLRIRAAKTLKYSISLTDNDVQTFL